MSRTLFNRSLNVPAPVRKVSAEPKHTDRPVYIERSPEGDTRFFEKATGLELTRSEAVRLMRAYKAQTRGVSAANRTTKPHRKATHHVTWTVTLYRTDLQSGASKPIASEKAQTFLAISTKLAKLCMQHKSNGHSAVEVQIEQVR